MFIGSTVGICMFVPQIIYVIKQRKITGLIAAISTYRPNAAEAAPINITQAQTLTVMDIPKNPGAKLICQDPWVSVLMTAITVIGVIVYLYRSCHHKTLTRGYKFASICELYVILCNSTRYVPLTQVCRVPFPIHICTYNTQKQGTTSKATIMGPCTSPLVQ